MILPKIKLLLLFICRKNSLSNSWRKSEDHKFGSVGKAYNSSSVFGSERFYAPMGGATQQARALKIGHCFQEDRDWGHLRASSAARRSVFWLPYDGEK